MRWSRFRSAQSLIERCFEEKWNYWCTRQCRVILLFGHLRIFITDVNVFPKICIFFICIHQYFLSFLAIFVNFAKSPSCNFFSCTYIYMSSAKFYDILLWNLQHTIYTIFSPPSEIKPPPLLFSFLEERTKRAWLPEVVF